ncbi:MAG: preprotein translocase subunit SecE [Desulfobacteraceae bacterium]|nr:preprotein translocase subunit SecE [Desulfobacteraceae bacterium]
MGRLLKKKDPGKKKAQKAQKAVQVDGDASELKNGEKNSSATIAASPKKTLNITRTKAPAQEQNFVQKSIQFLREVKIELKKVAWPTKKQTMGTTIVVLILVLIIAAFLGMIDFTLSSLIRTVLR